MIQASLVSVWRAESMPSRTVLNAYCLLLRIHLSPVVASSKLSLNLHTVQAGGG